MVVDDVLDGGANHLVRRSLCNAVEVGVAGRVVANAFFCVRKVRVGEIDVITGVILEDEDFVGPSLFAAGTSRCMAVFWMALMISLSTFTRMMGMMGIIDRFSVWYCIILARLEWTYCAHLSLQRLQCPLGRVRLSTAKPGDVLALLSRF